MRKEADRKPGSYLGTAWNCSNLKRSGSEIFRMEQPDRAWEPRCSSDHSASGSVGRLPDDNSDLFPVNENQELAILVSLLNQENERILRELEN